MPAAATISVQITLVGKKRFCIKVQFQSLKVLIYGFMQVRNIISSSLHMSLPQPRDSAEFVRLGWGSESGVTREDLGMKSAVRRIAVVWEVRLTIVFLFVAIRSYERIHLRLQHSILPYHRRHMRLLHALHTQRLHFSLTDGNAADVIEEQARWRRRQ